MSKSRDAFRTISEVSDLLDTPAHVLRFWESKFSQVKPVKRAGGRRYYRPTDVDLLAGIKKLLHDDGMTIKGAQKLLREQGVKHVGALGAATLDDMSDTVQENAPDIDESSATAPKDTVAATIITDAEATPSAATAEPDIDPTNVVAMPPVASSDAARPETVPSDEPAPQAPETKPEAPVDAALIAAVQPDIPADPTDSDSKAPARLFHLLHKASHDGLAARAESIAPLLDRMQVLRDRIATR